MRRMSLMARPRLITGPGFSLTRVATLYRPIPAAMKKIALNIFTPFLDHPETVLVPSCLLHPCRERHRAATQPLHQAWLRPRSRNLSAALRSIRDKTHHEAPVGLAGTCLKRVQRRSSAWENHEP